MRARPPLHSSTRAALQSNLALRGASAALEASAAWGSTTFQLSDNRRARGEGSTSALVPWTITGGHSRQASKWNIGWLCARKPLKTSSFGRISNVRIEISRDPKLIPSVAQAPLERVKQSKIHKCNVNHWLSWSHWRSAEEEESRNRCLSDQQEKESRLRQVPTLHFYNLFHIKIQTQECNWNFYKLLTLE